MTKTPYSEDIAAAVALFEEVRDSDLAKKGTADFAEGVARSEIIPRHLSNMKKLSSDQHKLETQITSNLNLVRARASDIEASSF